MTISSAVFSTGLVATKMCLERVVLYESILGENNLFFLLSDIFFWQQILSPHYFLHFYLLGLTHYIFAFYLSLLLYFNHIYWNILITLSWGSLNSRIHSVWLLHFTNEDTWIYRDSIICLCSHDHLVKDPVSEPSTPDHCVMFFPL